MNVRASEGVKVHSTLSAPHLFIPPPSPPPPPLSSVCVGPQGGGVVEQWLAEHAAALAAWAIDLRRPVGGAQQPGRAEEAAAVAALDAWVAGCLGHLEVLPPEALQGPAGGGSGAPSAWERGPSVLTFEGDEEVNNQKQA